MKKWVLVVGFAILLAATAVFASWYVLHGDIQYTSDVARDFLLLREISQKGIVLIGPSSSTKLFHGVLWMYLNYPVYFLSHGNPVASGWFWVLLSACSAVGGLYVAKKLFNTTTAYIFTLLYSAFLAFHVRYFYNPDGAMLIMPFVFFTYVRFLQTKRLTFLLIHALLLGAVVQFEMAIGIPLVILSFAVCAWKLYQWKKYFYMLAFLLVVGMQANFIIFDVRHEFLNTKLVLHFLSSAGRDHVNILLILWQRIFNLTTSIEFLRTNVWGLNTYITLLTGIALYMQIKRKEYSLVYRSFFYLYVGFFIVSMANAGNLLYFYMYPLFPLAFLMFASLCTSKFKYVFITIFIAIYSTNILTALSDMKLEQQSAGQVNDSWAFYHNMATKLFNGSEKSFGYFTFDPDIVAYQPKYALYYQQNLSKKDAKYFQKDVVTYLVIANTAYHEEDFWKEKQLHIAKLPVSVIHYNNGYRVEKYMLTDTEMNVAIEPNIDPGLMFR